MNYTDYLHMRRRLSKARYHGVLKHDPEWMARKRAYSITYAHAQKDAGLCATCREPMWDEPIGWDCWRCRARSAGRRMARNELRRIPSRRKVAA